MVHTHTHTDIDVSKWRKVDLDDKYAAGLCAMRFQQLAKADPFVAFFSEGTITNLVNLFFSHEALGNENITVPAENVRSRVWTVLSWSPLGMILNGYMKGRICDLVELAVLTEPFQEEE